MQNFSISARISYLIVRHVAITSIPLHYLYCHVTCVFFSLGKDLLPTDIQPVDPLALLAVHLLFNTQEHNGILAITFIISYITFYILIVVHFYVV